MVLDLKTSTGLLHKMLYCKSKCCYIFNDESVIYKSHFCKRDVVCVSCTVVIMYAGLKINIMTFFDCIFECAHACWCRILQDCKASHTAQPPTSPRSDVLYVKLRLFCCLYVPHRVKVLQLAFIGICLILTISGMTNNEAPCVVRVIREKK